MRKHRLAERHLLDVIGLDYAHVHEEACRWEHVMSREVEERIAARIEPPYLDPYGNPIPGLTELGIAETPVTPESKDDSNPIPPLTEVITERAAGRVRLDRIGERVQSHPGLLGELAGHGRAEEHTSELQSRGHLVCRLLLEKKNQKYIGLKRIDA